MILTLIFDLFKRIMTDSNSPSETKYAKGYMCLSFHTIFRNKCGKKLTRIAIKTETDEKNCIKRKNGQNTAEVTGDFIGTIIAHIIK